MITWPSPGGLDGRLWEPGSAVPHIWHQAPSGQGSSWSADGNGLLYRDRLGKVPPCPDSCRGCAGSGTGSLVQEGVSGARPPPIAGLHVKAELIPVPRRRGWMFAGYFLCIKYYYYYYFFKQQIILFILSYEDCSLLSYSIALSNFPSVPGESVVLLLLSKRSLQGLSTNKPISLIFCQQDSVGVGRAVTVGWYLGHQSL